MLVAFSARCSQCWLHSLLVAVNAGCILRSLLSMQVAFSARYRRCWLHSKQVVALPTSARRPQWEYCDTYADPNRQVSEDLFSTLYLSRWSSCAFFYVFGVRFRQFRTDSLPEAYICFTSSTRFGHLRFSMPDAGRSPMNLAGACVGIIISAFPYRI